MAISNKPKFQFVRKGSVVAARGEGWHYEQVGDSTQFRQNGKVPSLRVVKKLLKLLIAASEIE